jgi:hypothetical protein
MPLMLLILERSERHYLYAIAVELNSAQLTKQHKPQVEYYICKKQATQQKTMNWPLLFAAITKIS